MELTLFLAIGVIGTAILAGSRGFHLTVKGVSLVVAVLVILVLLTAGKIIAPYLR